MKSEFAIAKLSNLDDCFESAKVGAEPVMEEEMNESPVTKHIFIPMWDKLLTCNPEGHLNFIK